MVKFLNIYQRYLLTKSGWKILENLNTKAKIFGIQI
jgi:hypothetical protein